MIFKNEAQTRAAQGQGEELVRCLQVSKVEFHVLRLKLHAVSVNSSNIVDIIVFTISQPHEASVSKLMEFRTTKKPN